VPYAIYAVPALTAAWLLRTFAARHGAARRAAILGWACAVCAGAVILAYVSTGRGTPFGDFDKAYYPAGHLAISSPSDLYECGNADQLCFVNIPAVALAFAPLSALSPHAAHVTMTVIGVMSVALAIALLIALFDAHGTDRFVIATLVLLNGPLYYSLRLANLTHVTLVLFIGGIMALRARRQGTTGALFAVCALIKPPFMLFLPYLALRRQFRRSAFWFAATLSGVGAVSLLWFGADLHWLWLSQYVGGTSANPIGAYNAQSISGMLVRMTTSAHLVDWVGVGVGRGLRIANLLLTLAVLALAAGACWWAGSPKTWVAELTELSIVLCTMLLVSPVTWTHYYCFLLVPIAAAVVWRDRVGADVVSRAVLITSAILVSLPVALWIPSHPFFGPLIARGLLSHYVAGGGLLLCGLCALRLRSFPLATTEPIAA
jgi:hypothetical protein